MYVIFKPLNESSTVGSDKLDQTGSLILPSGVHFFPAMVQNLFSQDD